MNHKGKEIRTEFETENVLWMSSFSNQ